MVGQGTAAHIIALRGVLRIVLPVGLIVQLRLLRIQLGQEILINILAVETRAIILVGVLGLVGRPVDGALW